ncbi:MAG: polyprenyl synthetase family protein [Alphaproteobacteria bacterium]
MDAAERIERALEGALARTAGVGAPPRLVAAFRHAVFPGGARIRPQLALAVAAACGDRNPALADAAAASIELLHCASLVHDDLPCFDDADMRRGRPSVHRAFGEPLAVLAGDGLIVLAFETVVLAGARKPGLMASLLSVVARAAGAPNGIVAGQAWESEPEISLAAYQQAKTGALFAAATVAGATAAGVPGESWRMVGECLGEAFQVADDLLDAFASAADVGKPVGRDAALGRPNAVLQLGPLGARERFEELVAESVASVPDCPGRDALRAQIAARAARLLPKEAALSVA